MHSGGGSVSSFSPRPPVTPDTRNRTGNRTENATRNATSTGGDGGDSSFHPALSGLEFNDLNAMLLKQVRWILELICHCAIPAPHLKLFYRHKIKYWCCYRKRRMCCCLPRSWLMKDCRWVNGCDRGSNSVIIADCPHLKMWTSAQI